MRFLALVVILFFVGLATSVYLHAEYGPLVALGFCLAVAGGAWVVAGVAGASTSIRNSADWDDWPRYEEPRDHDVGMTNRPLGETRWVSDPPNLGDV